MQARCVVVADSNRARIFALQGRNELSELEDLVNPAARQDDRELRTDADGRFYDMGERSEGHAAEPSVSPKQHEAERFAHAVARYLNDARNAHRYDSLCLIAAPQFLGLLRQSLDQQVLELVDETLPKNLTSASPDEIRQYIVRH
jgi:protein required for attachment to host cells